MYKIFFDHKYLSITELSHHQEIENGSTWYFYEQGCKIGTFIEFLRNNPQGVSNFKIIAPANYHEQIFKELKSMFVEVIAGGGLVFNEKEEMLFIYRKGKWDLPKGKQEPDESIKVAAVREVSEECGIYPPQIDALLAVTYHNYFERKKDILKTTYWYKMRYAGGNTVPQILEDISRVEWRATDNLDDILNNTYPAIIDVLHAADVIKKRPADKIR